MRLATVRTPDGTRAGVVEGEQHRVRVHLREAECVGELLARGIDHVPETGEVVDSPDFAPVVPNPSKIICVGLNYRTHILEMGRELPTCPTLFTKFADTLVGAHDQVLLPVESEKVDWEAELAVVVGHDVRRASMSEAERAIAGFCIANDVSMRDWQNRTLMWDQGKFWERSTPLGPFLVTPDELPGGVRPALGIECLVNDQQMQASVTSDLVFDPVDLVRYASTITTLRAGDIILTGTPGGVGMARDPQVFLRVDDVLTTRIDSLGMQRNSCVGDG